MTGTLVRYLCCPCACSGLSFHLAEVFCCDRSLMARTRHSGLREKTRSGLISQTCSCSVPRHAHPAPCPCCLPEWPTPKTFLVPFHMWTQFSSGELKADYDRGPIRLLLSWGLHLTVKILPSIELQVLLPGVHMDHSF